MKNYTATSLNGTPADFTGNILKKDESGQVKINYTGISTTGFIVWNVPANALCRLVPTSSGTTTITWIRGQETY